MLGKYSIQMAWKEEKNCAGGTQHVNDLLPSPLFQNATTGVSVTATRHQRSPRLSSAQSAELEGCRNWTRDRRITLALGYSQGRKARVEDKGESGVPRKLGAAGTQ